MESVLFEWQTNARLLPQRAKGAQGATGEEGPGEEGPREEGPGKGNSGKGGQRGVGGLGGGGSRTFTAA